MAMKQKQSEKKQAAPRQVEAKASTPASTKGTRQDPAKQKKQPGRK